MNDIEKDLENKIFIAKAVVIILCLIATFLVVFMILLKSIGSKVNIVNRDGIAYIEYTDKTCKLLDSNGKQIPYTDTIKSEHKLSVASSYMDNTTIIVVHDESTNKYYIAMNDKQSEDITQTLSIMYDKDNLEEGE